MAHKTLLKSIGYDATNGKDKCLLRTLTVAAKLLVGLAIRSSASLPCCTTWNSLPFRLAVPVDSGGAIQNVYRAGCRVVLCVK